VINKMNLKDIKIKLFPIIKIISIPLITSAMGLELWNMQTSITNNQLPTILTPALIIAHFALSAHFIEAIIAAYYAPSRNQTSIKYAVYTFFVGTVGLLGELHKKHYPILWDGHLARPCIISGQDARTTRNFGIFFSLGVSRTLGKS